MIFKTKATLTCVDCGVVKEFDADVDIYAQKAADSLEIKEWSNSSIDLTKLTLEGFCSTCKDKEGK
jgi:Fe2+ or Zn2+ uptake regulation protein